MNDLLFDLVTRELVFDIPGDLGSDMSETSNPSCQNGGILLYARTPNLTNPIPGIGIEQIMNSNTANATFEMNRWQAQAKNDGATIARWRSVRVNNGFDFTTEQDYLPV